MSCFCRNKESSHLKQQMVVLYVILYRIDRTSGCTGVAVFAGVAGAAHAHVVRGSMGPARAVHTRVRTARV